MKKYTTVLFDLDGTLIDSGIGVTNSVAYALEKLGITPPPRNELFKFIGPPLVHSFRDFYGFDEAKTDIAVKYFREYYNEKGALECTVYQGIIELLKSLKQKGYKIALATSKAENFSVMIVENKGIMPYLDYLGAASADEKSRVTKEAVIEYTLELCSEKDKSKIVMIGDRHFDINGANSFGLDSIGVTYGYGSYEELKQAGATYIVNTTKEVDELLK